MQSLDFLRSTAGDFKRCENGGASGSPGRAGGDGLEDRSRRRCCHPSSGGRDAHTAGSSGQAYRDSIRPCMPVRQEISIRYVYNHSDRDLTDYLYRLKKAIDNPGVKVVQCKTAEELVHRSDIICTTTPSKTPVLLMIRRL